MQEFERVKDIRTRTKCGPEQRQNERTITNDQTEKSHSQEEHHSVEDLLSYEATHGHGRGAKLSKPDENTSRTNRKQRIQWSLTDTRWDSFDEDLDTILGSTLTGDVHRKIHVSSVSTIVYAERKERFGMSESRDMTKSTNKPNRHQQDT